MLVDEPEIRVDGRAHKMSKSRGNVVNPDDVVEEYGADCLRLYEMFMGPLEAVKPWSMKGVEGVHRFLGRVWRMIVDDDAEERPARSDGQGRADRPHQGAGEDRRPDRSRRSTDDFEASGSTRRSAG